MSKNTMGNMKTKMFDAAYAKDVAVFKKKLEALRAEIAAKGYWLGYHYTDDDGINLVMVPDTVATGEAHGNDTPEGAVPFKDVLEELEPLATDGKFAITLYPGEGCVDEACWVR